MHPNAIGMYEASQSIMTINSMTLAGKSKHYPLFSSQRCYGIDASGAICREETSEERRTGEHQCRNEERQWIARTHFIQDFGKNPPYSQ